MTLEEYIAFCIAEVARRRQQEQDDSDAAELAFQQLLQQVRTDLRRRIRDAIPPPLRQFADHGERPKLEELQGYPDTWTPSEFRVEAPGLRRINFTTSAASSTAPLVVTDIRVGETSFGTDWIEAVAAAVISTP